MNEIQEDSIIFNRTHVGFLVGIGDQVENFLKEQFTRENRGRHTAETNGQLQEERTFDLKNGIFRNWMDGVGSEKH